MMRHSNWFYSENDEDTVKSLDELIGMYEHSVGRGADLLINIGPDRNGQLPQKDKERLLEFGSEIRMRYEKSLGELDGEIIKLSRPELVNQVVLQEDLTESENIDEFEIYIKAYLGERDFLAYRGSTVGHKRICKFPSVRTEQITIKIKSSNANLLTGNAYYC